MRVRQDADSTQPTNSADPEDKAIRAGVQFEIARSVQDLEAAYHLVHDAYVRVELIDPDPSGIRASIFNALPDTATFVAKLRGDVISTLTLVPDSPVGLPMDQVYKPEVDRLRQAGRKLGEVSMLCDRRTVERKTFRDRVLSVFLGLSKVMTQYAMRKVHLSDLLIVVHPHHARFYTRYLPFERFAEDRSYASVKGNPAVPLRVDLSRADDPDKTVSKRYEPFVGAKVSEESLAHHKLNPEDIRDLFVLKTNALRDAPPEARQYVLSLYGLTEQTAGLC